MPPKHYVITEAIAAAIAEEFLLTCDLMWAANLADRCGPVFWKHANALDGLQDALFARLGLCSPRGCSDERNREDGTRLERGPAELLFVCTGGLSPTTSAVTRISVGRYRWLRRLANQHAVNHVQ